MSEKIVITIFSYSQFCYHIMTIRMWNFDREYMKQRSRWSLMLSFRLVVSVKWTSQQKNEISKTAGVWVNCIWRQQLSAHIWNIQFLSSTCIIGTNTICHCTISCLAYLMEQVSYIVAMAFMLNIWHSNFLQHLWWPSYVCCFFSCIKPNSSCGCQSFPE